MSNSISDTSPQPVSVSVLTDAIRYCLNETFSTVWVEGEVSNLTKAQSGHIYFALKDESAQLQSIIWRSAAARMPFDIQNGQKLICGGHIDLYPQRGSYQLIVQKVQPVGIGALELAFRQLKQKLDGEGLFDPGRKKTLPRYPRRIAVVTSPSSAAIRDFLQVLTRRWSGTDVIVVPVRVQGDGAAQEIAAAIDRLQTVQMPLDAIVVTRGGGSMEDLWCFNEEVVCRAIFNSQIPVVSGVGHEIDITLCDLVADVRALTPSEAAERIVPDRNAFQKQLGNVADRMTQALKTKMENAELQLDRFSNHHLLRRPLESFERLAMDLDYLEDRLQQQVQQLIERCERELSTQAAKLELVNPLGILQRGFSLTTSQSGKVLKSDTDVVAGERIRTRLADGEFWSIVTDPADHPD